MLADGSFDSIVQKWGLEESACLGQPGTDSVMKAEDTVKEKTGFLDNMFDILRQLLSGVARITWNICAYTYILTSAWTCYYIYKTFKVKNT